MDPDSNPGGPKTYESKDPDPQHWFILGSGTTSCIYGGQEAVVHVIKTTDVLSIPRQCIQSRKS
jgi:hypothetical protein